MRRLPLVPTRVSILLMTLTACASSPTRDAPHVTFVGPRFDLGPDRSPALAVTVDARGRVVALHGALPTPSADRAFARVPGEVAVAGLGDAHLHLAWLARGAERVDLARAGSASDAATTVLAFARANPETTIVGGDGWDQTRWPGQAFPTAADLAPDPYGRPIVLSRVDGHAVWLDAVALARVADLLAIPSPPPERVLRDAAGAPTGVIVDPRAAIHERLTPTPTAADLRRWITRGLDLVADAGLVEVHDMATSPAELEVLVALAAEGPLPARVVVYLDASEGSFAWLAARGPGPVIIGPDLEVRGVKLFADGALGSRGAALHAPYSDEPGHLGQATPPADLTRDAVRAAALGYDVAIHAIGDRGNTLALDALEAAKARATRPFRGRVEHAQVLDRAAVDRLVAGGFVASMQPTHATSDMRWAEARVGADRLTWAYAWRSLAAAGVALAFGSDAPVESFDPRLGLWAATRRQTPAGDPPDGWRAHEALSFVDAARAFSAGVAFAAQAERDRGALAVGQLLQLSVFDRPPSEDLLAAVPVATVRGRLVRAIRPIRPIQR
ncbi:MAG: amidohydrolase [Deltaproteobacteria bacterium]|nr:amidohydrolase [Deltaproteobacteria bacterium]